MKREAIVHTKMKRICRRLDIPTYQGVGLLESLWHLTAREAPRGDIGKLTDEDIALAVDWRGDESKLIDALASAGWLDRNAEFRLVVHDWHEHADDAVNMKLARAHEFFCTGQKPTYTRIGGKERESIDLFYSVSMPCASTGAQSVDPCAQKIELCAPPSPPLPSPPLPSLKKEGVENQSSGYPVSSGPPVEIRAVIRNGRTPEYRFLRDKSYLAVVAVAREFWPDSMDEDFDQAFYTWEKFDWEQKKQLTDNLKAKQDNEPGRGRFVKKSFREYIDSIEWKRPARPAASAKNGNGSGSEDVSYPYVPDLKHPEEEDNATTH